MPLYENVWVAIFIFLHGPFLPWSIPFFHSFDRPLSIWPIHSVSFHSIPFLFIPFHFWIITIEPLGSSIFKCFPVEIVCSLSLPLWDFAAIVSPGDFSGPPSWYSFKCCQAFCGVSICPCYPWWCLGIGGLLFQHDQMVKMSVPFLPGLPIQIYSFIPFQSVCDTPRPWLHHYPCSHVIRPLEGNPFHLNWTLRAGYFMSWEKRPCA